MNVYFVYKVLTNRVRALIRAAGYIATLRNVNPVRTNFPLSLDQLIRMRKLTVSALDQPRSQVHRLQYKIHTIGNEAALDWMHVVTCTVIELNSNSLLSSRNHLLASIIVAPVLHVTHFVVYIAMLLVGMSNIDY